MRLYFQAVVFFFYSASAFAASFEYTKMQTCISAIKQKDTGGSLGDAEGTKACNDSIIANRRAPVTDARLGTLEADGTFFLMGERKSVTASELGVYEYSSHGIIFHRLNVKPGKKIKDAFVMDNEWIEKNEKPAYLFSGLQTPCSAFSIIEAHKAKSDRRLTAKPIPQTGVEEAQDLLAQSIIVSIRDSQNTFNQQLSEFMLEKATGGVNPGNNPLEIKTRYQEMYRACAITGNPAILKALNEQNALFEARHDYVDTHLNMPLDQRTLRGVGFSFNGQSKPGPKTLSNAGGSIP